LIAGFGNVLVIQVQKTSVWEITPEAAPRKIEHTSAGILCDSLPGKQPFPRGPDLFCRQQPNALWTTEFGFPTVMFIGGETLQHDNSRFPMRRWTWCTFVSVIYDNKEAIKDLDNKLSDSSYISNRASPSFS
jgi:hypothetical protein